MSQSHWWQSFFIFPIEQSVLAHNLAAKFASSERKKSADLPACLVIAANFKARDRYKHRGKSIIMSKKEHNEGSGRKQL